MTKVEGLVFSEAYQRAVIFTDNELIIRTIHKNDLITTKRSVGRSKDKNDLENLL